MENAVKSSIDILTIFFAKPTQHLLGSFQDKSNMVGVHPGGSHTAGTPNKREEKTLGSE